MSWWPSSASPRRVNRPVSGRGHAPRCAPQGLAGTLVWQAGQYALDQLGARALVILADPGEAAIRIYRSVGFTDRETQLSLQRAPS